MRALVDIPGDNLVFNDMKAAIEFVTAYGKAEFANSYTYASDGKLLCYDLGGLSIKTIGNNVKIISPCAACDSHYNTPGDDGLCYKCREKIASGEPIDK